MTSNFVQKLLRKRRIEKIKKLEKAYFVDISFYKSINTNKLIIIPTTKIAQGYRYQLHYFYKADLQDKKKIITSCRKAW